MAKSYIDLNIEHYIGFGKLTKVSRDFNVGFKRVGVDNLNLTDLSVIAKNNTLLAQAYKVTAKEKKRGVTVIEMDKLLNGKNLLEFIKTLDIIEPNFYIRKKIKNCKIEIFRDDLKEGGAWFPLWIPYTEYGGEYYYYSTSTTGVKYVASNTYISDINNLVGYGSKAADGEIYIGDFDKDKGNINNIKIRFTLR